MRRKGGSSQNEASPNGASRDKIIDGDGIGNDTTEKDDKTAKQDDTLEANDKQRDHNNDLVTRPHPCRSASDTSSMPPVPPPRLARGPRSSQPGAFHVAPLGSQESSSSAVSLGSRSHADSLYVIPCASLVPPLSTSSSLVLPPSVTHEPELVYASPLDVGVLQRLSTSAVVSDNVQEPIPISSSISQHGGVMVSGDKVMNHKSDSSSHVMVNKRWLWLCLLVSCLICFALVGGIVYYVVVADGSANKHDAGSSGGGGGGNSGSRDKDDFGHGSGSSSSNSKLGSVRGSSKDDGA
ncbi:expressed unknown protein [Seminavis robusta]|uniref:Uncharacterized protein n=1 Tax=Seminavis robusta TaxID=568900 RepID=A0A9N8EEY3_9STRA|nr:expressed unknown protein [Seminavis robusta]|eukprot:Sro1054_g235950.1 n/a (295) ;mRNA; r:11970-12854